MEPCKYKVSKVQESRGYQLEGPGLRPQHIFRDDESRERLADIADLMNFAFEQGRRIVEADQQPNLVKLQVASEIPVVSPAVGANPQSSGAGQKAAQLSPGDAPTDKAVGSTQSFSGRMTTRLLQSTRQLLSRITTVK
jgi:hypothetical protein